jgi:adenylate cyclase
VIFNSKLRMETRHPAERVRLSRRFMLRDWVVAPDRGELTRNGIMRRVEPKAMEVLVYLAERQGEVVTRDDLERHVWQGALVGYDAITNTVLKLRKALGDDAREPRIIATIPKRGYRLVAPVRFLDGEAEPTLVAVGTAETDAATPRRRRPKVLWVGVAVAILLALAGLATTLRYGWLPGSLPSRPLSGGEAAPSVMVLPFSSLGDDPQQERFADGITEDLITDLSRLSHLAVIASNTSFSYKGRHVRPQDVGRELGVDFVVEGSIRRDARSVRVNARLVDARTGFERWAKRYDRPLAEVFAVQDAVTASVVRALAVRLSPHEKENIAERATDNLLAYDRFQEGQRLAKDQTADSARRAQAAYRSAIAADPNYGRAYGALAYLLARSFRFGWTDTPAETIDRALELARKAVALDPAIPQTHWALGYVYLMRRDYANAEAAARDALQVAPNYADGYGLLAFIKNALGQPQAAIELIERGMRLNPYYTWDYPYNLGRAYYMLGRIGEAIKLLEEARRRNENAPGTRLYLAASYIRAGRQADAEWEVQELSVLSPSETISHLKKADPIDEPKLMGAFVADLRKAGLPE